MKKNGFTLVELLAVIVILALLVSIAVPGVLTMSDKIQSNMFCTKIENIEKAAQLWGDDHYDQINAANNKTVTVKIQELLQKNYLKKDNDKSDDINDWAVDPRDNTSIIDKEVNVFIKNSRVYASYQYGSEDDEAMCKE